jgi:hypothetical protein
VTAVPTDEGLTTEKVWTIDSDERNPHLSRWALGRGLELMGLTATKEGNQFRVHVDAIDAKTTIYYRLEGPWYRPNSEFPCTAHPQPVFATAAGSRVAAEAAAKAWSELLSRQKVKLEIRLREVGAEFSEGAIRSAQTVFENWKKDLDKEYHDTILPEAREKEWESYRSLAGFDGTCGKRHVVRTAPISLESTLEPPSANRVAETSLLARAPAKRWNGLFSIRLAVFFGGKELNGQFLLDSNAPQSILSPDFLSGQGVLPAWVETPGAAAEPVRWSGGTGLGRPVRIELVKVAGLPLTLHEFLLHDTDFFSPPRTIDSCCDGILGVDFLSQYVLEMIPGEVSAVRIWPRESFSYGPDYPWVEAHYDGSWQSACSISPGASSSSNSEAGSAVEGARWSIGEALAIGVHAPWRSKVHARNGGWDIYCGGRRIAPSAPVQSIDNSARDPAFDVGMSVLARGDVTLDFPHGRIWFEPKQLADPVRSNHTGLTLEYAFVKAHRVLRVADVRGVASALAKRGLRKGVFVAQMDGKSAETMDQWEVERRLSGDFGPQVSLSWMNERAGESGKPQLISGTLSVR